MSEMDRENEMDGDADVDAGDVGDVGDADEVEDPRGEEEVERLRRILNADGRVYTARVGGARGGEREREQGGERRLVDRDAVRAKVRWVGGDAQDGGVAVPRAATDVTPRGEFDAQFDAARARLKRTLDDLPGWTRAGDGDGDVDAMTEEEKRAMTAALERAAREEVEEDATRDLDPRVARRIEAVRRDLQERSRRGWEDARQTAMGMRGELRGELDRVAAQIEDEVRGRKEKEKQIGGWLAGIGRQERDVGRRLDAHRARLDAISKRVVEVDARINAHAEQLENLHRYFRTLTARVDTLDRNIATGAEDIADVAGKTAGLEEAVQEVAEAVTEAIAARVGELEKRWLWGTVHEEGNKVGYRAAVVAVGDVHPGDLPRVARFTPDDPAAEPATTPTPPTPPRLAASAMIAALANLKADIDTRIDGLVRLLGSGS